MAPSSGHKNRRQIIESRPAGMPCIPSPWCACAAWPSPTDARHYRRHNMAGRTQRLALIGAATPAKVPGTCPVPPGSYLEDRVATNCHGGTRAGGIGRHNLTGLQQRLELIGAATPAEVPGTCFNVHPHGRDLVQGHGLEDRVAMPNTEVTDRGRELPRRHKRRSKIIRTRAQGRLIQGRNVHMGRFNCKRGNDTLAMCI